MTRGGLDRTRGGVDGSVGRAARDNTPQALSQT